MGDPAGRNAARLLLTWERRLSVADPGGPSFPILGYESLTAAQITSRVTDLAPAELRKVRDHERRNANRKSVLAALERQL